MMAHHHSAESLKENLPSKAIKFRDINQAFDQNWAKSEHQMIKYPRRDTMLLLATTAAAANANPPDEQYNDDLNKVTTPSNSLISKGSNQMDTEDNKELGKHLDDFVQQEAEEGKGPMEGEILFGPGHTFFWPLLFSWVLVAQDLHTPNLQHIFWAPICIPLPPSPANATDAMFDVLDKFVTKMQEANQRFLIFPHNLLQY